MVFQTFKIYITDWVTAGAGEAIIDLPINFRAHYNTIYLKYAAATAFFNNGGAYSITDIAIVIKDLVQITRNIEIGTPVLTNMGAATAATSVVDGIAITKGGMGDIKPIELNDDFVVQVIPTLNAGPIFADDIYLYVTIGYDV